VSELVSGALRALVFLAVLALAAFAIRRRRGGADRAPSVTVVERQALARDVGLALVTVEGRRLLLGYGPRGVGVVAELAPATGRQP
jgi:flagellar protein FliO/FliZ